jgi:hypothetical protein
LNFRSAKIYFKKNLCKFIIHNFSIINFEGAKLGNSLNNINASHDLFKNKFQFWWVYVNVSLNYRHSYENLNLLIFRFNFNFLWKKESSVTECESKNSWIKYYFFYPKEKQSFFNSRNKKKNFRKNIYFSFNWKFVYLNFKRYGRVWRHRWTEIGNFEKNSTYWKVWNFDVCLFRLFSGQFEFSLMKNKSLCLSWKDD